MRRTPSLNCKQLVEIVTDYLEGAMDARDRARFDAHLRTCRNCRAYLDQMRATIALLGRLPEESLAPEAKEELLAVFRDWKAERP